MSRQRLPGSHSRTNDLDAALTALSADELRDVAREMLGELDDKAHSRVLNSLIDRAARNGSGWMPAAPRRDDIAEVLVFVRSAKQVGYAEPSAVDEHLGRATIAFLRRDYGAAFNMFGALLPPIAEVEFDLGHHESVDEVLGSDPWDCAVRYVVSAYMLSPPSGRTAAVLAAIHQVHCLAPFWEPIQDMERVAIEPLPGLAEFLREWRTLIEQASTRASSSKSVIKRDRWMREVVLRLEGSDGLASLARSTRHADDLHAWCRSLVVAGNWQAALLAFEEAAGLAADDSYTQGSLLDGAALAAQELSRDDLPMWLERAWRAVPSMRRLLRWIGSADGQTVIRQRAAEALMSCPKQACRQRAFLHVLRGEFELAATLLAVAPGLGWSSSEHPGHLLFPLFTELLDGKREPASRDAERSSHRSTDLEDLDVTDAGDVESRLVTPAVEQIIESAGIGAISSVAARDAVLLAMRKAAEKRVAGVTDQKRRRYYRHAAELVAACVHCDQSSASSGWATALRHEYRRFPALRDELDTALGRR